MAQQPAPSNPSPLTLRLVSAAVMFLVVLGPIWLGGWVFAILLSISAGVMYWEWQAMCGEKGIPAIGYALLCGAGPVALLAAGIQQVLIGWVLATLVVFMLRKAGLRAFLATGFAYIFSACVSIVWLRNLDPAGMETVVWLGVVVVMTDTCAYFTGRTLGGPKLAPTVSPKKTWSGLIGGVAGAAVSGGILAAVIDANIVTVALVSGGLAIVAQIGDLAVSKAKRAFGVKDSGNIIPGHGGALDRFDGVLAASIAIALLSLAGGGSPLLWL
jgi:phosphatidate cytidylyltransferase